MSSFIDTSTECAICLNPLDNGSDKTITLSCGHRWHLDCIKEQLQNAQPSRSKRLVFSGCRCAKCQAFCDHPELENLTRRTDVLREKVDGLIAEQLKVDTPGVWSAAANDSASKTRLIDEGRRSYAFYLCGGCDAPYFGGTIECADEEEGELTTSEDRLCQSCSPKSQIVCQKAFEHRRYHVWKCRYCCNPSSYVCYGNVHFCNGCHDRNTERYRRKTGPLEAILCSGEDCPFPKPEGCDKHSNGPGLDCEQVYYCACCNSSPSGHEFAVTPGSRNFIINPSGEDGTRGWQHHGRGRQWSVEQMEVPVDGITRTNFVSSHQWCTMLQSVALHEYVRQPSLARIEVSAKFMGRTDCPSLFKLEALVIDSQRRIIHRAETSILAAPVDFWEKASLIIDPIPGAHEVAMVVRGKDARFWAGNFGSKVCHCSVRVLGTDEELGTILLQGKSTCVSITDYMLPFPCTKKLTNKDEERNLDQVNHREAELGPNYAHLRERMWEIIVPFLLILFCWLISD